MNKQGRQSKRRKRWKGVLLAVLLVGAAVMAFLYSFAPFGAGPSKADREDYARRATGYFDGKTFYYPAE